MSDKYFCSDMSDHVQAMLADKCYFDSDVINDNTIPGGEKNKCPRAEMDGEFAIRISDPMMSYR